MKTKKKEKNIAFFWKKYLCVFCAIFSLFLGMQVSAAEGEIETAKIGSWDAVSYSEEEMTSYKERFYLEPINVTSNKGHYGSSSVGKVADEDMESHFEANASPAESKGTYVEFAFEDTVKVGQIVYRVRQDDGWGKGFAAKFKIQTSMETSGEDFVDVAEGSSAHTKDFLNITFEEKECKRLRFVWEEATNGYPSASVLYCFAKDDSKKELETVKIGSWMPASYTEEERAIYDEQYKLEPVSVTSNKSNYPGATLDKAYDMDLTNHWEAYAGGGSSAGTYIELDFGKSVEVGQVIYRSRMDADGKGFPLQFKIQVSGRESGNNFRDIAVGSSTRSTDILKITFEPTKCRRLRFVWTEAYNDFPSASVLYCYKEDMLGEELQQLFADGAGTDLAPGVTTETIEIMRKKVEQYPVQTGMMEYINLAELLLTGKDITDRVHKPMVLTQRGDREREYKRTGITLSLSSWDLTGYYVRPGDILDIFVEADPNSAMPRLVLAEIGRKYDSWQYGYDGMVLAQGYNRIMVPETMKGCQAIYFYNPSLPDEQAYAPIIRMCGGERYPVYFYDSKDSAEVAKAKEAAFIEELTEYCTRVENNMDKAALGEGEPNICEYVSDKVLVSVTAKGALRSLDREYVWNQGIYKQWAEEKSIKHGIVERDSNNQVTGIRYKGPACVMEAYEMMFDDMQLYCGFNITDPAHEDYRNHGVFVFRAYTDGWGAGWAQKCYSGYNAGSADMDSPLDTGWFTDLVQCNAILSGGWTEYHELGHMFDSRHIGVSESTNNLFALQLQKRYRNSTRMEDDNRWWLHFTNYINTGVLPSNDLLFYPGAVINQLDAVDFIGKSIYSETDISNYGRASRYARLHEEELSHLSVNDRMVVSYSMSCGVDLSAHFEYYGREVSKEAKLLLNGLPKEERPTWLSNDRTFKGGALTEAEKEKAPVIQDITSDAAAGVVTIKVAADTFTEENVQCFAIYRQKKVGSEVVGEPEWIGVTGDNFSTKNVNELYQFTDNNVVPGTTYEYSVGVYDCKLEENEKKATATITVGENAEVPVTRLLINDGVANTSVGVGNVLKLQAVYSPSNTTVDLNTIDWWVEGYGDDSAKTGGGPDVVRLEPDPDYPSDPTRRIARGIQSGHTKIYVKLGSFTENLRLAVNGNLAVNDTDSTKYTFAFEDARNTFKVGETYTLNLFRTTCEADGTPTSEVVRVATAPNGVSWESSNEEAISVSNRGVITVNAAGKATISFKRGDQVAAQCELTAVADSVPLTGITPDADAITMEVGENSKLRYSFVPANATSASAATIVSDNSACVRVEKDSTITAVAGGTAKVTITIDGVSAEMTVTVNDFVPLKGIALNSEKITLNGAGTKETVTIVKTPSNASVLTSDAIWETSDASIFTVENGVVTAVGTGTGTLTVRLGGKITTVQVVVEGADIELTGIGFRGYDINEDISLTLKKGKTHQLSLILQPADATSLGTIHWSSTDEEIAAVAYGYVTALEEGTATVTASLTQNEGKANAKTYQIRCNITVESAEVPLKGMGISQSVVRLGGNETVQLSAYKIPINATIDAQGNKLAAVSWTSADDQIATVDSTGKVTAKATGITTITATGNGYSVSCRVTVNDANLVESISLNKETFTFDVADEQEIRLSYTVQPQTVTAKPLWESSNPSVLEVSQDGKLTANKVGTAVITVTLGDQSASCEVTVTGKEYLVNFDSDGGTQVSPQTVTGGKKATKPENPEKSGYTLYGWYQQGTDKVFDFATDVVRSDMTLVAKWQVNPPTASKESGSEVVKNTEIALSSFVGGEIYYTLDGTTPTKGSIKYEQPIVIAVDTTIKAFSVKEGCVDSEVVTFDYTMEKLSVTFDLDGGTGQADVQRVKEGQKAVRPETNPTKTGFIFKGWYLADSQGKLDNREYDFESGVYEHITIKAKWEEKITVPKIKGYTQYTEATLDTTKEYIVVAVDSDNRIYALYGNANGKDVGSGSLSGAFGAVTAQVTNTTSNLSVIYLNGNVAIDDFEKLHFTVKESEGKYSLQSKEGYYLALGGKIFADAENFLEITATDGSYSIKNPSSGRYLSLNVNGDSMSHDSGNITDFWGPMRTGSFKICLLAKNPEGTVDKDSLLSVVEEHRGRTQGDYSNVSWAVFETALQGAENVLADDNAGQEAVDRALIELEAAFAGLYRESVIVLSGNLNKAYDGKEVTSEEIVAQTKEISGEVTYKFFTDEACTNEASWVKNAGTYYVKAFGANANVENVQVESNVLSFTISPATLTIQAVTVEQRIEDEILEAVVTAVEFTGLAQDENLVQGTDYTVTAVYDSEKVNEVTKVTVTVKLNDSIVNYVLANSVWEDNVTMDKVEYTVTFQSDGNTVATKTVEFGEKATEPEEPVKEGFVFKGWTLDGADYDFETTVKKDITLIAKWQVKAPTADIASGSAVPVNTQIDLRAATGAEIYYTLDGSIPTTASSKYTEKITLAESTTIKAIAVATGSEDSEVATFTYTVTQAKVYLVSFDCTGGTEVASQYVEEGKTASKPSQEPSKEGYVFKGWKWNGADYDFNTLVTEEITLTAIWEVDKKELQSIVNENKDKVQSTYTDDSWKAFTDALSAAQEVLNKSEATKEEVEAAKAALEAAITALTEKTPDVPPVTPDDPVIPDDGKWGDILPEDRTGLTDVPTGIWAAGIEELTYNGTKQTQEFRVYDGNKMLVAGKDYTATIKNNQNACTDKSSKKAPQVVLKMKGDYRGTKNIAFKILPADISDESVVVDDIYVTYNGKKQTPAPAITWNGKKLGKKDFYVKEYKEGTSDFVGTEAGSEPMTLTLVGQGNFTGEKNITLTIGKKNVELAMDKMKVTAPKKVNWDAAKAAENDGIILDGVVVKDGKTELKADEDYTVSYENNKAAGTATMILTGTGDKGTGDVKYYGVKRVTFTINGTAASKFVVNGLEKTYTYTGEEIKPLEIEGVSVTLKDGTPVPEGAYKVSYEKNVAKGTAAMILTANPEMGYTGTKKVTFKIAAANLDNTYKVIMDDAYLAEEGSYAVPYIAGGATPQVVVTDKGGNELTAGVDYTVSYKNNKAVAPATATKAPTVVIKGKGNYAKSTELKFAIAKKVIEENDKILTVVAKDKVESNKWKQSFKVYDVSGKALSGKDYEAKTATYTLIPEEGEEKVLTSSDTVPAGSVIRIDVTLTGDNYSGKASGTYRIIGKDKDISKAVFKIAAKEYTGEEIKLTKADITKAELKKSPIVLEEHYEIVGYEKNINKGTAKVTFRGINGFGGEKTVTFKITQKDAVSHWWSGIVEALFD